jgi:predicted amidohydrolase YtcJ
MKRIRKEANEAPGLLFHSGNVVTLDPRNPSAQAVAVSHGRISWVGRNDDIVAVPTDEYRLINLAGRTLLPSFGDAHVHFAYFALSTSNVDLDGCTSYEEALDRCKQHARKLPPDGWLVGKGWAKDKWAKPRLPHKADLDRVSRGHPAAIFSKDEHLLWANSAALKIAGIDRQTSNPAGGQIDRGQDGDPSGVLRENACILVWRHVSKPSKSTAFDQIDLAVRQCHAKGVTSVGNFDDIANFELLQEYHQSRGLKLRVRQYIPVRFLEQLLSLKLRSGFGDNRLAIAGVKIFADGSLGSQTALMFEPFAGSRKNAGVEVTSEAEMKDQIRRAAGGGLACAVHAIGDRANSQTINAFEALPKKLWSLRHRIEHVQIIGDDDIARLAHLGLVASVQPSHCSSDIYLISKYLGKRSSMAYSFKTLLKAGSRLAFGSDAPIEKLDPVAGIWSAVTRKSFDRRHTHRPDQRLAVGDAIRGFTSGIAYALGDESSYGVISPGYYADLILLEQNPAKVPTDQLRELRVAATFLEGECVHGWDTLEDWGG